MLPQPTALAVLTLPPVSASSRDARRFVAAALDELGLGHLQDGAVLAVSELVTNAVLHARTAVDVTVDADEARVRVSVGDLSADLPVVRSYGAQATTGRGLSMVRALVDDLGVTARETGKTVWFTLLRAGGAGVVDHPAGAAGEGELDLAEWGLEEWGLADEPSATSPGADDAPTGVLRGLPVALWLAAHQHHDAALRELVLARGASAPAGDGPSSWYAAADAGHTALATAVDRALAAALAAGVPVVPLPPGHPSPVPALPAAVDVPVALVPALAGSLAALAEALDDADRLAGEQRLLIHPALPEVVALRDWCCHQLIAQAGGSPAAAWEHPGDLDALAPADAVLPPWDDSAVQAAPGAVIAVDDRNRVIAVSPAVEQLVGWAPHDLVGRRVVTLIPPKLREAHVAGFTRHQVTGEAHVLGVEVSLPVLHAAGDEVQCRFLIDRAPATGGRSVYLAALTPL